VGLGGCVGDPAGDLRHLDLVRHERKRHGFGVGGLHFQPVPVDGPSVKARRRAGLEAAHFEPQPVEPVGEGDGRRFDIAPVARRPVLVRWARLGSPGGQALVANMDDAFEEGAGGEDHGFGANAGSAGVDDSGDA